MYLKVGFRCAICVKIAKNATRLISDIYDNRWLLRNFHKVCVLFFSRKTSLFGARVCTNAHTNFCEFAKNCGAQLCFFVETIEFEACEFRPELETFGYRD